MRRREEPFSLKLYLFSFALMLKLAKHWGFYN